MKENLWIKESDRYTERAQELLNEKLFGNKDQIDCSRRLVDALSNYISEPKNILDIGCAYGGLINELVKKYERTNFFGVDPGKKSIEIANNNLQSKRVFFIEGCSDKLPFEDGKFDVVILTMVMQWIRRSDLIKTISEVDRVLKTGGLIYLEDYLSNQSVTSISTHNKEISIYKDNYSEFFSTFPWFKEVFREVTQIEDGSDHQSNISVLRKYDLKEVYTLKKGPLELHTNLFSDDKYQIFKNLFYK
jgi:ubiquinone/menaquinone biosynthesis C-methylase UbiE